MKMILDKVLIILLVIENRIGMPVRVIAWQFLAIMCKNRNKRKVIAAFSSYLYVSTWATALKSEATYEDGKNLSACLLALIEAVNWPAIDQKDLQRIAARIERSEPFDLLRIWEILAECRVVVSYREETYCFLKQLNKACLWHDSAQVRGEINKAIIKFFDVLSDEV